MTSDDNIKKRILPVIVLSQFAGVSLWFAGNAILNDLQRDFHFGNNLPGIITSAVQLGFIAGTLCFAFFTVSDKFSPRLLFLLSSIAGAIANVLIIAIRGNLSFLLLLRFVTGFFLAGIYPVGMKIASGWYNQKLGKAIGYLVGALVAGTAFPHLLKSLGRTLPWENVIWWTSGISLTGGLLMYICVPDGPFIKKGTKFNPAAVFQLFRRRDFRLAAFGYFGHMWELYAFWTFVPVILASYSKYVGAEWDLSAWSFVIIGSGSIGCIAGGFISQRAGSPAVALSMLLVSGVCCFLSPIIFRTPAFIFLLFMILWGISVVGDSPQFSTIAAQTLPDQYVGTGLTILNCIGFAITIPSIQLVNYLVNHIPERYTLLILSIGPVLGVLAMIKHIGLRFQNKSTPHFK